MRSLKTLAIAAAMAALAPRESPAADLPMLPPPPIEEFGGWYLRGDIGMSNQRLKRLDLIGIDPADTFEWLDRGGFDSAPFFGIGIGYRHNNWFRWDITGEYRGKAHFAALDRYDTGSDGSWDGTNDYTAKKSELLFLFNAYLDLGTWKSITPFVGAGIGASRNTISNFRDINEVTAGVAYANDTSKWEFAWALYAGFAYDVTPNFTIELAYRYLDLGDAMSGDVIPYSGPNAIYNPVTFKNITSHDLKLGVRWALADLGVSHWAPPPAPIVSKY
ncbi:MAG: porin family protein [Bradyrhizobiaceae bacterium]|nr:porin family protein [Bradyrhizobiaceae bacterium]